MLFFNPFTVSKLLKLFNNYKTVKNNDRTAETLRKIFPFLIMQNQLYIMGNNYFILRNDYFVLTCSLENNVLKLFNRKVKNNYAIVDWEKDIRKLYFKEQCPYIDVFREICRIHKDELKYNDVLNLISTTCEPIEHLPPIKFTKPKEKPQQELYIDVLKKDKIDINSADDVELSKLPGINIVRAKKIIEYRELNSGFKTVNEFYVIAKIKESYIKKIEQQITINEYHKVEQDDLTNERIIDF